MTADGRTKLQLTNDPGADHYPDWSPDGKNVVFQSDRTGRYELYILSKEISSSGWSSPEQLTFDGGVFGKWSPDGSLIAFNSGTDRYSGRQQGEESLKVISPGGGDSDKLVSTDDPSVFPTPFYPSWSKDSRTIYFKARDEKRQVSFWSVPVEGGTPNQLVIFDDPSRRSSRSEYATDGQRFFFTLTENESDISLLELLTN